MRIWPRRRVERRGRVTVWSEFRRLHAHVSWVGRRVQTNRGTSNLATSSKLSRRSLSICAHNNAGEMIGGGFFTFSRDEGVYAVAAYDRSLFDKPLGHVVQYRAIEELRNRGVRWYKIGARRYRSETPPPPEKEVTISEFKQGFASHLFPRYNISHPVCHGEPIDGSA